MKLRLIWPGKCRQPQLTLLIQQYWQRINRLVPCEIVETGEARGMPERERQKILKIEGEGIAKNIQGGYIICLSDQGHEMSSAELKDFLTRLFNSSVKTVNFIVGGFLGLDESILKKADKIISLSRMTFSHETVRLMLVEQLYRVLTMTQGLKYAK
jgi:23S rRNA (pseudouridine1915-N3)-methyltransferase